MEKERKIIAPEGCEIEKMELVDGVAVVTFKEKEMELPKSWGEFEKLNPIKVEYVTYDSGEIAYEKQVAKRYLTSLLSDSATAEAVLALMKLILLRNCYNGDWVPDWTKNYKYVIEIAKDGFISGYRQNTPTILYFKTKELRDEFLRYFRPLIEKLKPLYGIVEGGEA